MIEVRPQGTLDLAAMDRAVTALARTRYHVYLWGPPETGKSWIVDQYYECGAPQWNSKYLGPILDRQIVESNVPPPLRVDPLHWTVVEFRCQFHLSDTESDEE